MSQLPQGRMNKFDILVRELCDEIDSLRDRLEDSQGREKHWRHQYNELLNDGIKHGEAIMANTVLALIKQNGDP